MLTRNLRDKPDLGALDRLDSEFLKTVYERHPVLHDTYRFHIDTWCLDGNYYPQVGDSGRFATRDEHYKGVTLSRSPGTEPSMYRFLWDMYELTGDPAFVRVLYRENGNALEGLPLEIHLHETTSGIAAVLEGGRSGPTIVLRGDMDGLAMPEDTGLEFSSEHEGQMHACGHDLHTTMLIGAARMLSARREELAGQVLFMFQPGEEGHFGARFMLEEGLLQRVGR